jgi:hypothetical protein
LLTKFLAFREAVPADIYDSWDPNTSKDNGSEDEDEEGDEGIESDASGTPIKSITGYTY